MKRRKAQRQGFNVFLNKSNLHIKRKSRSILIMRNNFKRIGEGKRRQEPYWGSVLKFTECTLCKMLGSCPNTCKIRKEFEFLHICFCKFVLF